MVSAGFEEVPFQLGLKSRVKCSWRWELAGSRGMGLETIGWVFCLKWNLYSPNVLEFALSFVALRFIEQGAMKSCGWFPEYQVHSELQWSLKNTGLNVHLHADVFFSREVYSADLRLVEYMVAKESGCGGPGQPYILLSYLTCRDLMLIPGVGWVDVCKSYVHMYTFSFSMACMRRKDLKKTAKGTQEHRMKKVRGTGKGQR